MQQNQKQHTDEEVRKPQSALRLIRRVKEFLHHTEIELLPRKLRGIYVLYKASVPRGKFPEIADVVYVGLSRSGIRGRLRNHAKQKTGKWTHVSVFEVWENIRDDEIVELEGLFRHIYRKDPAANALNKQGAFLALKQLEKIRLSRHRTWDT